jgi:sugar/nucleoside kinase (ribokinase family)
MPDDKLNVDIIIMGHIAKDIIEIDGKSKTAIGGAVYYGGIAGSHMGLKILVITRLKEEDRSILQDFNKFGVKYYITPSEETSGLRNIYKSHNMEYRICKPLGFAGLFSKEEIPDIETEYFVIGPILAGEIDIALLDYLYGKYSHKICLDIQGFVRVRENDKIIFRDLSQKDKKEILSKVYILKLDQAEAEILTNKKNIQDAAEELIKYGPKEILITHEKGISVYTENKLYSYPWKYKVIRGRTGRGDTAFISYIGSKITKNSKDSLKFAAALTSLKLESPGPFTLPLYQVKNLIKKEYYK